MAYKCIEKRNELVLFTFDFDKVKSAPLVYIKIDHITEWGFLFIRFFSHAIYYYNFKQKISFLRPSKTWFLIVIHGHPHFNTLFPSKVQKYFL